MLEVSWKTLRFAVAMTVLVLLIMFEIMQMAILSSSVCHLCVCVCVCARECVCKPLHLSVPSVPGFPRLDTTMLENCSVNCRMFNNIPDLYTLNARGQYVHVVHSSSCDNQKCLQTSWQFFQGAKLSPVENHCSQQRWHRGCLYRSDLGQVTKPLRAQCFPLCLS